MGRRAYINRLALGRSPYEAPEIPAESSGDTESSGQRRTSPLHADGYVQHYDERGHPVNPQSKTFGRELRRAKNDILSTMGIVVSEDANRGRNQQEKIDAIVTENDLGLAMVTLDQFSVFLGSWWTTSLTGRIQTFRSFAHVPLTRIINYESASFGLLGFYFAGIPAWAMSTCLSICRHHPLERLISWIQNYFPSDDTASKIVRASFTILHSAARGALLVLAMQTYMYSSLQSLHLIPPASVPGIGYFMPFGKFASMILPSLPLDVSFKSIFSFALAALKTPSLLYVYVYLRPLVEVRLYRLIRRQLPKPDLTDQLSVKVAFDNDLVDWMVPVLGRRGDEEAERSNLSLVDDLLYELGTFRQWLSSKFTFISRRSSLISTGEHQHQCDAYHLQGQSADHSAPDPGQQDHRTRGADSDITDRHMSMRDYDANSARAGSETSNEENQLPEADNMNLLRRARNLTISTRTSTPDPDSHQIEGNNPNDSPRQSQSHARRSRTPSIAPSPSSPHLRAQTVQDPDVVAMQLGLQSHQPLRRSTTAENTIELQNAEVGSVTRRSTSDLLDTLLANEGQHVTTILSPEAVESESPSMAITVPSNLRELTTTSSFETRPSSVTGGLNPNSLVDESAVSAPMNILPDVVEEPPLEDLTNQPSSSHPHEDSDNSDFYPDTEDADADAASSILPHNHGPTMPQNPPAEAEPTQASSRVLGHRVTVLSSLPVDSLASHLASMITTALFAPLESLYLRSLASSYLASRAASSSLRADVYPLNAWGGGHSRNDKIAYMGKLALMMGLQATVNASVWGIISGAAIRIGRKFCGWGEL